ncbi:hypothetical protein PORY_001315 [Pneumocystis oryctolagi]|uniref:Uncharacterized protein n=1 Tax=Pneumocystis oryctolagi TaxID=42067 RepID=A0ACB7CCN7_9ASCO|nr:hypothetical protein PORY_001315 [Pneumocystis oryctolagi]
MELFGKPLKGKKKKCFVTYGTPKVSLILSHPFNFSVIFVELCFQKDDLKKALFLFDKSTYPRFITLSIPLSWQVVKFLFLLLLMCLEILCALSMNHIDTDDVICVNKGVIILSLTKETYEKAGLTGKPSVFSKMASRWNVTLDMRDSSMKKGKKGFNRILWSFENNFQKEFLFRISASNNDDIKIIEEVSGLSSRFVHFEEHEFEQILCPSFLYPERTNDLHLDKTIKEEWAMEIYEWLGLVSLRADRLKVMNNYDTCISTYSLSNALEGDIVIFLWSGMINCTWILNLWESLKSIQDMNWFSLTVNGFEDSPISWENCEHGYFYGGENMYTLLKLNCNNEKDVFHDSNSVIPHFLVYEYALENKSIVCVFLNIVLRVSETAQELISRIEKEAKKYENNKVKPISKHTFTSENGMKIDSWRLPDFGFKKPSKVVMDIRGLFSTTNEENIHKIVIRGYNKFFAVDEVKITKWEMLEKLTKGPYTLTLKENGCIIFISALSDISLVISSKHSMGPSASGTSNHAQMGEIWLDRHLSSVGRTREQLARVLWEKNVTLVSELCDDSFEEHIIEYPPEKRGLYLHGINKNESFFSTAPFDEVYSFGIEWGFMQVDFTVFQTLSELKRFLQESEKTKTYQGKEIEGFVIRCKSKSFEEDVCFNDFFFKYKFKEPYFLYRRWREITHSIISDTYTFNNRDLEITKEYVKWVRLLLKKEPELAVKYKQNHGIVALRKRFLIEYNYSHSDLSRMLNIIPSNSENKNILLVTIGTIGCGKTTLSHALTSLFGFGHIQNDDILGKKAKIQKFSTKIAEALKNCHVVIADKNNHKFIERKELIHLVSELLPDTRFVALYYHHFDKDSTPLCQKQELSKIFKVTQARVVARGSNHQTIDASPSKIKTVLGIMNGFLSRFEPLNTSKEPDSLFENVIVLDPIKDTKYNLKIVIDKLLEIAPNYIVEIPSESRIDSAISSALNNYKFFIQRPLTSQSCKIPEYFAIVLKDNIAIYVEEIMKDQSKEKRAFWDYLNKLGRVQHSFHVTLIHIKEMPKYPEVWESLLSRTGPSGVICQANVEVMVLVWDSRIMALAVKILDAQEKKIESVNPIPHITIGTENKTILPKESNDLLVRWRDHPDENDIMSLTLSPKKFSGTAVAVYPTSLST